MADNFKYWEGDQIKVSAAGTSAGDPFVLGQIPGVCLNDADDDDYNVLKRNGTADLEVEAVDADGVSAIAAGDILYYTEGDDPHLNKKTTGVRFGYALEAVASSTGTIEVLIGY
jgi:hypothetical protein